MAPRFLNLNWGRIMTDGQVTGESEAATTDGGSSPKRQRPQTYGPTKSFWIILVLAVAGFAVAHILNDDPAVARIVGFVGVLLCLFNLGVWFFFRSGYSTGLRRGGLIATLGLIVATVATVRVESFSGSLIPTLKFAWTKAHDETLGELATNDGAGVDLLTTSPLDFPQFLGPQRNQVVTGANLSHDWSATPPQEIWRREVGAGWSGFAVVNGFAVTMEQRGEQELVTCYAVDRGEPQWSSSVHSRHKTPLGFLGPRSTPTIHNGRVYAQGAAGILRCLDGANGKTIWQRDFFAEIGMTQSEAERAVAWGRANSPLVVDDKLIVAVGGPSEGQSVNVAALDLETGETIWEGSDQQISYASPITGDLLGTEQIVVTNERSVSGHDLQSGEELWEFSRPGNSGMDANCSQPIIVDSSHVLASKGYGMGAEMIQLTRSDAGEWQATSAWSNRRILKTKFSNVSVVGDYAYALDDGVLCCADVNTGERMWKKGRYKYGQILAADDLLLVLGEFGELALVEASPTEYRELGRIQVLEGQTWNTLCLTGNRLLVRNAKEAACYELPTN
jgi:outer membrane protein assembly factor BamB